MRVSATPGGGLYYAPSPFRTGSARTRAGVNFAQTEFSEVWHFLDALMCFVPWRTYIPLTQEYALFVTWPTWRRVKAQDGYLFSL